MYMQTPDYQVTAAQHSQPSVLSQVVHFQFRINPLKEYYNPRQFDHLLLWLPSRPSGPDLQTFLQEARLSQPNIRHIYRSGAPGQFDMPSQDR